jgi:glycosyltransferase involved in cell wall biosynthesis
MGTPALSIVLPVYNAAAYVAEAVESILAQTFSDFELILVDDGSTDGSREILAGFRDKRVRLLNQPHEGLVAALNRGIREARGEWIARMDADDVALPSRLAAQMGYLRLRPEIGLLGGFVATMDEHGRVLADVVQFPEAHRGIWRAIGRRHWVLCHPTAVFRKDLALEAGLYDPAYLHAEDVEFFARLMTRCRAANLPEVVLRYRLRPRGVCVEFKDHGRINAELVAKVIDRWKPGQPFRATQGERTEADARIARTTRRLGPSAVKSVYHCRVGRELLRGGRWAMALKSYARAVFHRPWSAVPYVGMAAACLRVRAGESYRAPYVGAEPRTQPPPALTPGTTR